MVEELDGGTWAYTLGSDCTWWKGWACAAGSNGRMELHTAAFEVVGVVFPLQRRRRLRSIQQGVASRG